MSSNNDLLLALRLIAEDMANLLKATIEDDNIGWNNKTGTNTLKNSNLANTIKYHLVEGDNPSIDVMVNDYIQYIERGRHVHHSPKVPIDALKDWVKRKLHKQPTNQLLFAIQQSIYNKGIRPRPIMHYWFEAIDKEWNKTYGDIIFESLTTNLDKLLGDANIN